MCKYMRFAKTLNKGKPRSNEVTRSPRLHIEHLNSYYDKKNTNADFLGGSHVKRYCDVDRDDELLPPPAAGD